MLYGILPKNMLYSILSKISYKPYEKDFAPLQYGDSNMDRFGISDFWFFTFDHVTSQIICFVINLVKVIEKRTSNDLLQFVTICQQTSVFVFGDIFSLFTIP